MTLDGDGYPFDEDLDKIKAWPPRRPARPGRVCPRAVGLPGVLDRDRSRRRHRDPGLDRRLVGQRERHRGAPRKHDVLVDLLAGVPSRRRVHLPGPRASMTNSVQNLVGLKCFLTTTQETGTIIDCAFNQPPDRDGHWKLLVKTKDGGLVETYVNDVRIG